MSARSSFDPDYALAILLQAQFNEEIKKSKQKDKENVPVFVKNPPSTSLADPEWEVTDPCPDIHALFIAFNTRFFWGKLSSVEVKWSPQMTSPHIMLACLLNRCAGVCVYQGRGGLCSVRLSAPLLKLRPRSDLVETLLHEMIHAYLFVTNNNRDRDGHGPEFHKHMNRINKEAGVNITVYHSFHAEVKLYKQHWWRCDGECQRRPPFYGMVKRARNRPPGPSDLWWDQHRAMCSGQFVKVREPEGYGQKKGKPSADVKPKGGKDIRSFYNTVPATLTSNDSKVASNIFGFNNANKSKGSFVKPSVSGGNETNRVVGFVDLSSPNISANKGKPNPFGRASGGYVLGGGSSNTNSGQPKQGTSRGGMLANRGGGTLVVSAPQQKTKPRDSSPSTKLRIDTFKVFSGSGNVIGSSSGLKDKSKSRLLNDVATREEKKRKTNEDGKLEDFEGSKSEKPESCVVCVICNKSTSRDEMDMHLESCLSALNIFDDDGSADCTTDEDNEKWRVRSCPVCSLSVDGDLDSHVNECLDSSGILNLLDDAESSIIEISGDVPKPMAAANTCEGDVQIVEQEARVPCPICGLRFGESRINGHVNQCLDEEFANDFS